MKSEDTHEEFIADIRENGKTLSWPDYAKKYGINSGKYAQVVWKRYAEANGLPTALAEKPPPPPQPQQFHNQVKDDEKITTDSFSRRLYSEADVAAFFSIDTDIWEVEKTTTNYWEQGAKIQVNGNWEVVKTPLYQIKLVWRRKEQRIEKLKKSLLSQIKLPKWTAPKIDTTGRTLSVEVMVTDLHLGKIGFDPDTMEFNWTLKEAANEYHKAVQFFVSNLNVSNIAEFVLPIGNDYLNVDNSSNTTKRGTPQMAADFWYNVFRFGKETAIAVIEYLANIAPVHVYMIRGNHDEDSVFTLGECLAAYFNGHANVKITNQPIKRSYHRFGLNMIGYDHGHNFKTANAVHVMASDEPVMFAQTKFRSFHLGHWHSNKINKVVDLTIKEERYGVDVEVCPSMSPCDEWHAKNGYVGNLRRSKCFVRHFDNGLVSEIYYNVSVAVAA